MENSLHETKEIQWDWDEDDEGVVAEQVVIDGKKYIDIDYFNQKMYDHKQRFQDQSDLIEKLKSENHALISDNAYQEADLFEFNSRIEQLQKKLAEKEEQLKNAIVPKFKRGQEVYTYNKYQGCIYKLHLISIHIEQYETTEFDTLVYRARRLKDGFIGGYLEEELFATEEEAQAKLEELQGE